MSTDRVHSRRPSLHISTSRKQDPSFIPSEYVEGGALTPDVQGSTSPTFQNNESVIWKVGKYLMLEGQETSGVVQTRKALNLETQQEYLVKVRYFLHYLILICFVLIIEISVCGTLILLGLLLQTKSWNFWKLKLLNAGQTSNFSIIGMDIM